MSNYSGAKRGTQFGHTPLSDYPVIPEETADGQFAHEGTFIEGRGQNL